MNIILDTDSYKASHYLQYPPGTKRLSAYIEARKGGIYKSLLFFGLQLYLKKYLSRPVTLENIEEAEAILKPHGLPFNRKGWKLLLDRHGGYLPVEIEALPEGTFTKTGVPLVQIHNTDPDFFWLPSYLETALLRAVWYPTTVASISNRVYRSIWKALQTSSDDPDNIINSRLHDFGARGATCREQAGIGGLAHLVNFEGTDTLEAIRNARQFYHCDMAGYSIPAAEHSTITSWGEQNEQSAYTNIIETFCHPGALVSVVSDSYDLWHAVDSLWGKNLKDMIIASGGTLVVRPDSGDPIRIPLETLERLGRTFGTSLNRKGYRVLHPAVRIIQGDGMDPRSIEVLLDRLILEGWSAENIAFGMGGGLIQKLDRDSLRFAMKANAREDMNGVWHDVMKRPATDPSKGSKPGRQAVVMADDGDLRAIRIEALENRINHLRPVFRDGVLLQDDSLDIIRKRARTIT